MVNYAKTHLSVHSVTNFVKISKKLVEKFNTVPFNNICFFQILTQKKTSKISTKKTAEKKTNFYKIFFQRHKVKITNLKWHYLVVWKIFWSRSISYQAFLTKKQRLVKWTGFVFWRKLIDLNLKFWKKFVRKFTKKLKLSVEMRLFFLIF